MDILLDVNIRNSHSQMRPPQASSSRSRSPLPRITGRDVAGPAGTCPSAFGLDAQDHVAR
jgi:hypothetical protein